MAYEIFFFGMEKRLNSTKVPDMSEAKAGTTFVFKSSYEIDAPTIVITASAEDMAVIHSLCNYAEMHGTYYWITGMRILNNAQMEIDLKIDVLATYKDEILATKAYVLYSDSAGRTDLTDTRNVATIHWNYDSSTPIEILPDMFEFNGRAGGTYILQVFNDSTAAPYTACTYSLSTEEMSTVMSTLYSNDIFTQMEKWYFKPSDLVFKCIFYPFSPLKYAGAGYGVLRETVKVGGMDMGTTGAKIITIPNNTLHEEFEVDITSLLGTNYNYTDGLCNIKCNLPFVGVINLSPSALNYNRNFKIDINLDIITGALKYTISYLNGTRYEIAQTYKTMFGVECPLSYMNQNIISFVGTALGTAITALATKNAAASAETATKSTIAKETIAATMPGVFSTIATTQYENGYVGNVGSYLDIGQPITVNCSKAVLSESVTAKKEVLGLPCCSTVELSTLTGFVQCQGASVAAVAMENEISEINNYLNGGFYIE